ncbi:MAG: MFS transporter [Acidobacteria bacterium]|nr:MAG: MFS transporter [Acidobacteriota bacterium]PYS17150.1 MAG: MFS transporter [Acidobacteriota bacterium]
MITVENLTKRYATKTAIESVSFQVEKGEILGFLGPNGAGKTTTMRIVVGFMPASDGTVRVDGFDVFENPLDVRRRIGYLPENPPLYPEMTVAGYLRFVAKIKGVPKEKIGAEVKRVMERVSITDVQERIIAKLSKGYKQRVGLAQALIGDPPVMILDEPTIGLDPKQIHEVRELIKGLAGNHTVVLSTHILPEVEQTCNRVVIIDRGKIVAIDTPQNLRFQLQGAERVFMEIQGPVPEITSKLKAMPGVIDVHTVGSNDGRHRFQIEGELKKDIRSDLARTVVQSGWGLYELQSASMSLEDIFLKLTTAEERE